MQNGSVSPTGHRPQSAAREALAQHLVHLPLERGVDAIPMLREALGHPDPWIRVHAVEGLSAINHPDACAALTAALHDSNFGVHQTAARALVAAGRMGVLAVLRALVHDRPSTGFLHGADYVLHHARLTADEHEAIASVRATLHHSAADLEAPLAAFAALDALGVRPPPAGQPEPWYRGWRRRRSARAVEVGPLWPVAGA